MRLLALVVIATVGIGAGQIPVSQTQPPRDIVKRAEPTGTARIRGRVVSADRGTPIRRANVNLSVVMPPAPMRGALPERATGMRGAPPTGRGQFMTPRRATTDIEGQFEFAGLPAGHSGSSGA